ncbi:MAG: 3'(2'),5'-bisphosphate nucleotidase CysQ [Alphaproteobacteria bacterium]
MTDLLALAEKLIPAARAAGAIELKYYHEGADVIDKADGSPVTRADQEAEALIAAALKDIAPDIPMVGEESVAAGTIPDISGGRFFLVDPLDGTREFITGGGDFTVNIALLENFIPVMGIIYVPVSDALYYGANGKAFMSLQGAPAQEMRVRAVPPQGLTVVASKRHGDPEGLENFLKGRSVDTMISRSSSLKFCVIAAGEADLYPRLGPTSEWDTAAGDAILRAAGGKVTQLDGQPLVYGKADQKFLNPAFVAFAA